MDAFHRGVVGQIKAHATRKRLTLSHLADLAGVGRSHYWDVMKGRASPTLKWVDKIAQALEVNADVLLSERAPSASDVESFQYKVRVFSQEVFAGGFSEFQIAERSTSKTISSKKAPAPGVLFALKVLGTSMEPTIPANSMNLFREGAPQDPEGRIVLVERLDSGDPSDGGRYTVKRLVAQTRKTTSRSTKKRVAWMLQSDNARYDAIKLNESDRIIAEWLTVLDSRKHR